MLLMDMQHASLDKAVSLEPCWTCWLIDVLPCACWPPYPHSTPPSCFCSNSPWPLISPATGCTSTPLSCRAPPATSSWTQLATTGWGFTTQTGRFCSECVLAMSCSTPCFTFLTSPLVLSTSSTSWPSSPSPWLWPSQALLSCRYFRYWSREYCGHCWSYSRVTWLLST